MGAKVSRTDSEWSYTEEPHASRRKEILQKHPELKQLMGIDTNFKWIVLFTMALQVLMMYFIKDSSYLTIFLTAYFIGGVLNHALSLALHEIAHNQAFGHDAPLKNRWFGIFVNLLLGVPISIAIKRYHMDHHRYLGDDKWDADIPSRLETRLFHTTGTKLVYVILLPIFYVLRPFFAHPKTPTKLEIANFIIQITFDASLTYYVGFHVLVYLLASSLFPMGLHPLSGHYLSDHYIGEKGYETCSYYGPLNWVSFNIGYHVEHHDFPSIPATRLPEVKRIAKEYYDHLPHHTSWVKVIYDFITDPTIGPSTRGKQQRTVGKISDKAKENNNAEDTFNAKHRNGSSNHKSQNGNARITGNGNEHQE